MNHERAAYFPQDVVENAKLLVGAPSGLQASLSYALEAPTPRLDLYFPGMFLRSGFQRASVRSVAKSGSRSIESLLR